MRTVRRQPVPLSSKFDSWSFLLRATLCGAALCGAALCERNAPVASFFP
jgi:hypothetical protein